MIWCLTAPNLCGEFDSELLKHVVFAPRVGEHDSSLCLLRYFTLLAISSRLTLFATRTDLAGHNEVSAVGCGLLGVEIQCSWVVELLDPLCICQFEDGEMFSDVGRYDCQGRWLERLSARAP